MSGLDLQAFVDRSRALLDADPPTTRRETRTWLVDPFLERLGWDVHDDSCFADVTVDGTALEYVPVVDGVPALLVAVEPFEASLERSRTVALIEAMAWTGIDRAIYTDGHDYLLLARTSDLEHLACRRSSLPDHEEALAHYTRATLGQRLEPADRASVARRLAVERDSLVASLADELTATAPLGETHREAFEAAAGQFVDGLVASIGDDRSEATTELEAADTSSVSIEYTDPAISGTDSAGPGDDHDRHQEDRTGPDQPTTEEERTAATDSDTEGEYVVRFFNDRGSIGAVGHSSSAQALVATAEYLFDRGLSGIAVPWHPDDDEDARAVLNDAPTHPDGTPMTAPEQLSNGRYLETAGDVDARAARVEALVSRAGLRAMLTGDWG